jgi:hypothetical protein
VLTTAHLELQTLQELQVDVQEAVHLADHLDVQLMMMIVMVMVQ